MRLAPLCLAIALLGAEAPKGTEIHLRLKTKAASNTSRAGDAVEAVLTRPVAGAGGVVIPSGVIARGKVKEAKPAPRPEDRALLALEFTELTAPGAKAAPLAATLKQVENAREGVDKEGRILGIQASETMTAQMDRGIDRLSQRLGRLGDILGAAKSAVVSKVDAEIVCEPGTDLILEATQPVRWDGPLTVGPVPGEIPNLTDLERLAVRQPFQTTAASPPKPSDLTNLMFVGTEEELAQAFQSAGWNTAAELSAKSKLETFRAIAENRGYKEAPMSTLLLEGEKAAFDFQKQHNTFAARHHLRIWRRPDTFLGKPVWVCGATHDTGIEFSAENKTFIHKIDTMIDRERSKVVNDLIFGGRVQGLALIGRPAVPRETKNATGDEVKTDGRVAVLLLR
ncbi:MAG: LssY C-terminal domain-containing protein [Acidobacteria bacterium]|nr:LssY C-terminal domain-containing protein [Acidobacteriota bacterium]